MKLLVSSFLIVLLFTATHARCQESVLAAASYKVSIDGTSNLHAWSENVGKVTSSANVVHAGDGSVTIQSLNVIIEVYSIKSHEGSIMDNNTYKALKASQFPEITFTLAAPVNSLNAHDGIYTFTAKGNITIAGVTKSVDMTVKLSPTGGKLIFDGSQKIKMTDYNISPPTAIFGTLKTGNEITINYSLAFSGAPL